MSVCVSKVKLFSLEHSKHLKGVLGMFKISSKILGCFRVKQGVFQRYFMGVFRGFQVYHEEL